MYLPLCLRFRAVRVSSRRQLPGPDVEGTVPETPGPVTAGRALLHTGPVQVTHTHTQVQALEEIDEINSVNCVCVLSVRVVSDTITIWFPSLSMSWVCCINNRETSPRQPHTSKTPSKFSPYAHRSITPHDIPNIP